MTRQLVGRAGSRRGGRLYRRGRKLVRANGPADMGNAVSSNVDAMLATVLAAVDPALSDPSHAVALACDRAVGRYQERLYAILWRAYRIANTEASAIEAFRS